LRAELDALGPVAHLVSPNKLHHLFLDEWARAYPSARMWGLPDLIAKRGDLDFSASLTDSAPENWAAHIDQVVMRGSVVMHEIVFFHRASRTAIFGDLIENFEASFIDTHWTGWFGLKRRVARVIGIMAPDGRAPLDFRATFLRRRAARESLARVLAWTPERVIMAHGAWIDRDGLEFLRRSFRWLS
jgi:hypothetical protein